MSLVIGCHVLIKTYAGRPPVEAVRRLDLKVERGECFVLLGPMNLVMLPMWLLAGLAAWGVITFALALRWFRWIA